MSSLKRHAGTANMKRWNGVIAIASVIGMFVWRFIEGSFAHAWLAIIIGAFVMSILGALSSEKKNWRRWSGTAMMGSLIVMFIWAFKADSYQHAWIAIMGGVLLTVIFGALDKGDKSDGSKLEEGSDTPAGGSDTPDESGTASDDNKPEDGSNQ